MAASKLETVSQTVTLSGRQAGEAHQLELPVYFQVAAVLDLPHINAARIIGDEELPAAVYPVEMYRLAGSCGLARGRCFLVVQLTIRLERDTDERTVACLLYTSPSPRDRTRSRMPSSA